MIPDDCRDCKRSEVELDGLLTADERRTVSVETHQAFRESLAKPSQFDEVDAALDEEIQVDPYVSGTNTRRSDKELARMLDLIDNLPISENGKGGQA